MTRKLVAPEPLLSAVARKLGQAAGSLANITHILTTDQPTEASRSRSNRDSIKRRKSPAKVGQDRTTKQRHASLRKRTRTAKPRTASRRTTTGTQRGSSKKR